MISITSFLHYSIILIHHYQTTMDTVVYIIIILLGTTGNSVVINVAGFRMKPNVTNVWLVNLAIADLIFCLTRVTSLVSVVVDYWPFGDFLCKLTGLFKYTNMFCSVFLLAVISVDRVLCVWRPVFMRKTRTLCAARVISLWVWIVAIIFSSPYFVYRGLYTKNNNLSQCSFKVSVKEEEEEGRENSAKYVYFYLRFICGFLVPFLVIFTCYTLAAIGIRRTRLTGKAKPLRILALVVFAFFFCWFPYHILGLVKLMDKKHWSVQLGWRMASNLAYFNSCVNPVLYFCMGLDLSQRCNQSLLAVFHRALTEEGQTLSQKGTVDERLNSVPKADDEVHHTPVSVTTD
ncbi:C3a anaphylatoxin chemotactic receptor-like [Triplophysa dalaica]|uniref:C3a anaphylatoxin chemotactic receptor-like n=1 Tax=Triplophysa dalaica TaxID=1582913 RepID=UPI0024E01314|nr:C3a anaphylatoxin chemotactic receptor-like [Triplophysa dalaica]XP_056596794.1 C3a anaphylatoxin chemotactic receptor-like [Triplophysa dalaica]XP_056596795.1 C3a anaphylatoxin chemotactic receptor-like [Triplophysa dalaica]